MGLKQNVLMGAVVLVSFLAATAMGLKCYHCGQYNDGVGSITPCINDTHMKLLDCPNREHNFCIKYTSEGTMVRDCVKNCIEKEDWGSRTFCCQEDACNLASTSFRTAYVTVLLAFIAAVFVIGNAAH